MIQQDIQHLLKSIALIVKNHQTLLKVSGSGFNIFRTLKMDSEEVKLHSAFLAEILNPKGSHGMGDVFLNLFLEQLNIENIERNDNSNAQVIVEEHIGKVDINQATGGRIDIVIKCKTGTIVIENKIYAPDQDKQLVRYMSQYPNAYIIYLTLDGKEPNPISVKNEITQVELRSDRDFHLASYSYSITEWLVQCRRQAVEFPMLRETISQYINLIKYLTGNTMNNEKSNSILDTIISSGENLKSAIEVSKNIFAAKQKVLMKFAERLKEEISKLNPRINISINRDFGYQFCGIQFYPDNRNDVYLQLSFLSTQQNFYLEIYNNNNIDTKTKKIKKKNLAIIGFYQEKLKSIGNNIGKVENVEKNWHGDWVCRYKKLDNLFLDSETWAKVLNLTDTFINEIANNINDILKVMSDGEKLV